MKATRFSRYLADESGSAILFVVMLLAVLAVFPVSMQLLQISNRESKQQLNVSAQADNVARAGLTDTLSWFRRQNVQPVRSQVDPITYPYPDAVFYPRTSTNTATSDTIDESIGLVKEYALSENTSLWARYEVLRQANTATNPVNAYATHDITDKRVDGHSAGEGLCWSITSAGYVYRRRDANVRFDQSPNEVVGRAHVATEIRRLGLSLPVNGAVLVNNRSNVSLQGNGWIIGGSNGVGLGYYQGSSAPSQSGSGNKFTGTPASQDIDGAGVNGSLSPTAIFGVTPKELKLMADISATTMATLPADYPTMALVYYDGNAVFTGSQPLRGGGVLYVNGNLTISATTVTSHLFNGLIYVTGNATIQGPSTISGCLIVQGSLTMNGSGDVASVEYDSSILNSTRQQIGQYRENKSTTHTISLVQ